MATESVWSRARKDTEHFRQSTKSFWALEVVGTAMFGLVGGFVGHWRIPVDATSEQQFWYPGIGATIGVILGFVLVFAFIFAWHLFRAPYRQRNEALAEIASLTQGKAENKERHYSIVWYREKWWLKDSAGGRTNYWDNEKDGTVLLLEGSVTVMLTRRIIQVESVILCLGGKLYPSDWESQGFYTTEERVMLFDIPLDTPRGKRTARLQCIVDGSQYETEPFTIEVPKGQQVFRMEGSQI
ncbi:MAG: hypothetical protein HY671_05185 [Chloroflexi bacterium]|nr:hypothetical protein [Chloroflexota bacterium]